VNISVPDCPDEWSTPPPPGLVMLPDFISEEEEKFLLEVFKRFRQDDSAGESDLGFNN